MVSLVFFSIAIWGENWYTLDNCFEIRKGDNSNESNSIKWGL